MESGSWREGIPFVNLGQRPEWVNEFFNMVSLQDGDSEAVEIMAVRKGDWSRVVGPGDVPGEREKQGPVDESRNKLIPSESILPPHIEEKTFGEQPFFPTDRRPVDFRRPMDFHRKQAIGLLCCWRDLLSKIWKLFKQPIWWSTLYQLILTSNRTKHGNRYIQLMGYIGS